MPSKHISKANVVALTGGIASGKTAVSDRFKSLGVPVIDTDLISRDLVKPRQPLLASLISAFGAQLLDAHGRLMRRQLRELVFSDPQKRAELEAIMHPAIRTEALRQIGQVDAPYCLLVIPLLAESKGFPGIDRVLVIDVPEETQIARVMKRDGMTRQAAEAILAAQVGRAERLAIADDVIANTTNLEDLHQKVDFLHQKYLALTHLDKNQNGAS